VTRLRLDAGRHRPATSISAVAVRHPDDTASKEETMEYLALIYADEAAWSSSTDAERAAVMERYRSFAQDAQTAGVMVAGSELAPTATATTVRVRDDEHLITDGPFAEAKEALGGYFVLDCPTMDAAVDWASRIPAAEHGAVEVRQVHVGEEA
jgi:hypothetical protein